MHVYFELNWTYFYVAYSQESEYRIAAIVYFFVLISGVYCKKNILMFARLLDT